MASAQSIILHHYQTSPFSEKVRLALRMKNLAWASVEIPNMMPKPLLMPLRRLIRSSIRRRLDSRLESEGLALPSLKGSP